jgi:hypothetical protein
LGTLPSQQTTPRGQGNQRARKRAAIGNSLRTKSQKA